MQRLTAALAIAALALGGCTTTYRIRRPDTVEQIEPLHTRARYAMTLLHERPPGATSPAPPPVAPDPNATANGEVAPPIDLSNLRGYRIRRRGQGAFEGWGFGFLAGAVAGAALGFAGGDDPKCMNMNSEGFCLFELTAEDKAFAGGVVGALVGGLIGTVIGAAHGHTDEYVFRDPHARP
jgi:hypothetical protein